MSGLPVPAASAGPERLADWAELTALSSADRNISVEDIANELRRAGTAETLLEDPQTAAEGVDQRSELTEGVVDAVFTEFDERAKACSGAYPFSVEQQVLQGPRRRVDTTYTFLLLLGWFGKDAYAGPRADLKGDRLFEDVCADAFRAYLGPTDRVKLLRFGHPRGPGAMSAGFRTAVDEFCEELGEGGGVGPNPRAAKKNDARLDLIAWRPFPDGRAGKIVGYGQCSTSKDWELHLTLRPSAFNKLWLREVPLSDCTLFSFFPHRLERDRWPELVAYGGIPFDRCRVAHFASRLDSELRDQCRAWSKGVIEARVL